MEFKELEKVNVSGKIEKKGRFNYLSWPFAVSEFRKACPNGVWVINRFNDLPYQKDDCGCFVSITVYPEGEQNNLAFEQIHPVLNSANKTILEPTAFDINTSIQRCLVKAIAISTGIGLYIYAGEDLPIENSTEDTEPDYVTGYQLDNIKKLHDDVVSIPKNFLKVAKINSLDEIPTKNAEFVMGLLQAAKAKQRQPGEE